jgi:hypothetical protein
MHHNKQTINEIVAGYLEAACWASTRENEEPLDSKYSADDFTSDAREKVTAACERFVELALRDLKQLPDEFDNEFVGHNLYLTAAGHGTGFWDRDLGVLGDRLTEHAKASHYVESAYECGNNRHIDIWIEGRLTWGRGVPTSTT